VFCAADPRLEQLAGRGTALCGLPHRTIRIETVTHFSVTVDLTQHHNDQTEIAHDPSVLTVASLAAVDPTSASTHKPLEVADLIAVSAELDRSAVDLAAGRIRDALDRVRRLLAEHPGYPRAMGMFGQIAVVANHPAIGLASLQRAFALDPRLEHRIWLAICLAKIGCAEDAANVITAGTGVDQLPPTANAHFAVGMVLYAIGHHDEAARFYASCVALDDKRVDARHRYARALQAAGKIEPAIAAYRDAIGHGSTNADYHADLSAALSDFGSFEEARAAAQVAVELDPGCIVAHNNLGHALQSLNRAAEAVIAYQNAIDGCDAYPKARLGQALALLKCGDFERGWQQYEWRWQDGQTPRPDPGGALWRGEDISGQTILLHAEQGFGDTLQFVRFAPLAAARGGHVVLEVPAPLVRLLRGVEGVARVVASGEPLPPIDWHCPMASLPLAFSLRLGTIPASPYLHLPPEETEAPVKYAGERQDLVVGLVWAGDPRHTEPSLNRVDRRRSTSLDVLSPLLGIDGVRFVSFQFGTARDQLAAGKWPIAEAMNGVTDFADTAVRLASVDLLISVDTAMVHLAGGLGMPVWMLSRFDCCWRWLECRADTPWYPSMRIFRQPSPGDWSSVVTEVGAALREVIRSKPRAFRLWRVSQAIDNPDPLA
jgi:tetratricopeptide (TPR) repeat protein